MKYAIDFVLKKLRVYKDQAILPWLYCQHLSKELFLLVLQGEFLLSSSSHSVQMFSH